MGNLFSSSKAKSSQTTSVSLPDWMNNQMQDNSAASKTLAGQGFQGWSGPSTTGLNGAQTGAMGITAGVGAYAPQQVGVQGGPQTVQAGDTIGAMGGMGHLGINNADLSGYMDPYTQHVINANSADIDRGTAKTMQDATGKAALAGAFGGDRAAIEQAELASAGTRAKATMGSQLRSQAFQRSQDMAQQDIARKLGAQQTQDAAALHAGISNQNTGTQWAGMDLAAQQANQGAGLAGANLRLGAGNQLFQQGEVGRQADEAGRMFDYSEFMRGINDPYNKLSWQQGIASGMAPFYAAQTTAGYTPGPSNFTQIMGGISSVVGAAKMMADGGVAGAPSLLDGAEPPEPAAPDLSHLSPAVQAAIAKLHGTANTPQGQSVAQAVNHALAPKPAAPIAMGPPPQLPPDPPMGGDPAEGNPAAAEAGIARDIHAATPPPPGPMPAVPPPPDASGIAAPPDPVPPPQPPVAAPGLAAPPGPPGPLPGAPAETAPAPGAPPDAAGIAATFKAGEARGLAEAKGIAPAPAAPSKDDKPAAGGLAMPPRGDAVASPPAGQPQPFGERLRLRESSGRWDAQNKQGYQGGYQFGAARLADLGVYRPAQGEDLNRNQWQGQLAIPGFPNVRTIADFRRSPEAQQAVFAEHEKRIDAAIDRIPAAASMNRDGLRAVAHLGGETGMRRFIESGGKYDRADANGTRLSDYYTQFSGSDAPPAAAARGPGIAAAPDATPAETPLSAPAQNGALAPGIAGAPPPADNPDWWTRVSRRMSDPDHAFSRFLLTSGAGMLASRSPGNAGIGEGIALGMAQMNKEGERTDRRLDRQERRLDRREDLSERRADRRVTREATQERAQESQRHNRTVEAQQAENAAQRRVEAADRAAQQALNGQNLEAQRVAQREQAAATLELARTNAERLRLEGQDREEARRQAAHDRQQSETRRREEGDRQQDDRLERQVQAYAARQTSARVAASGSDEATFLRNPINRDALERDVLRYRAEHHPRSPEAVAWADDVIGREADRFQGLPPDLTPEAFDQGLRAVPGITAERRRELVLAYRVRRQRQNTGTR